MVHGIDKASKGIWKCYIGSIPILGVSVVQVHISDAVWSLQTMQALSVFPAEIIKMLALVGFKLIMNKVGSINAGNRTKW